jgi:hypothetical protein
MEANATGSEQPRGLLPAAQPMPGAGGAPTPEEQGLYNTVVANGMRLIYAPNSFPKVLKLLEGGGDPQEGLVTAATSVMERLVTSMQQSGKRVPSDILFKAGQELFEDLAHVSGKAGIHDFENDPEAMEAAFYRALNQLGGGMRGQMPLEMAQAEWGEMEQADQSGELSDRFRSLIGSGPKEDAGAAAARGGLMPKEV